MKYQIRQKSLQAFDRSLQDLRGNIRLFENALIYLHEILDFVVTRKDVKINYKFAYPATEILSKFRSVKDATTLVSHVLQLKVDVENIILRDISQLKLCNDTRIEGKIMSCRRRNNLDRTFSDVLIPHIHMIPTDMPFQLKSFQFPIR